MKIKTALILCAGFGKRLNPITLDIPKPLLKIYNFTLLEHCINLIKLIGIKKIFINSFYLKNHINEFIKNNNLGIEIKIIEDGDKILNTGGGILNLLNSSDEEDFLIFNPDTIWDKNYLGEIKRMVNFYSENKLNNTLLLVSKKLSFDNSLRGDFGLINNLINQNQKNYIYTGCQILNKSIFNNKSVNNFPISKIWIELIQNNQLIGYESKLKFYHVTNLEIFNKLKDL